MSTNAKSTQARADGSAIAFENRTDVSGIVVARERILQTSTNEPRVWLTLEVISDAAHVKRYVVVGDGRMAEELDAIKSGARIVVGACVGGRSWWSADIVVERFKTIAGNEQLPILNSVSLVGTRGELQYKASTATGEVWHLPVEVDGKTVTVKVKGAPERSESMDPLAQVEATKEGDLVKISGRLTGYTPKTGEDKGKLLMRVFASRIETIC